MWSGDHRPNVSSLVMSTKQEVVRQEALRHIGMWLGQHITYVSSLVM